MTEKTGNKTAEVSAEQKIEQLSVATKLTATIVRLGYEATILPDVSVGPIVSVYRFVPKGKTRFSHLEGLADDFAIALGAEDVLVKRLPGEASAAVFVPNTKRAPVKWLDCVNELFKVKDKLEVPLTLGTDHLGKIFIEDLAELPHLLIAGSTGSGKSTLLSSAIASLIYVKSPDEVNFMLSDTKGVEFIHFAGAPHLLLEPAVTVYQTLEMFDWVIDEMERRFGLLAKCGLRNVKEYNETEAFDTVLPRIVLVIDELADILTVRSREEKGPSIGKIAEAKLSILVQKGRAAGIHVIAATQRPSVNVVVGSIKANLHARLSFRLPSQTDSQTILSTSGAEHLLSKGDCLYISPSAPIRRLHAPLASLEEIRAAVEMAIQRSK